MKRNSNVYRSGKIGYILLWLLGIPIPILLLIFLLRGCTRIVALLDSDPAWVSPDRALRAHQRERADEEVPLRMNRYDLLADAIDDGHQEPMC